MPESSERGALTEAVFYILLALYEPTHGYGIMKFIRALTEDRVILGSGTLYGAINTLLKNSWIRIDNNENDDRKCYVITEIGKENVKNEIIRLKELILNGEKIVNVDMNKVGDEENAIQSI